jgi:hypothetical protein
MRKKSAASFSHQVAAWAKLLFRNFYLVKNHKIVKNSTIAEAGEKNKHKFGSLRISEIF